MISQQNTFLIILYTLQEDLMSTGLKTLISISTVVLLVLIVAYHMLEIQVKFTTCPFKRQTLDDLYRTIFHVIWEEDNIEYGD